MINSKHKNFKNLDKETQNQILRLERTKENKEKFGSIRVLIKAVENESKVRDRKNLKRIIWLESALKKKVDKKIVKVEVKKQNKFLENLLKRAFKKLNKNK